MNRSTLTILQKAAFEFILIVVGVLTAFGLQEFAQSISDERQKNAYLNSIRAELIKNNERLKETIRHSSGQDSLTEVILLSLDREERDDSVLQKQFEGFFIYPYLLYNLGSFEALRSSSSFDKINNVEISTKLTNLDAQVKSTIEFQSKIEDLFITLFFMDKEKVNGPFSTEKLSDKIFSRAYKNDLRKIQYYRRSLKAEYVLIRQQTDQVIQMIDDELM